MKTYKNVKKGDKVTVVFNVGVAHPIYNKEVEAIVDFVGGYDGRQIHAHTVEKVHHPENPEGILRYGKNGRFLGYEKTAAYDEIWEGYVERVIK